jgi:hypothetical protein
MNRVEIISLSGKVKSCASRCSSASENKITNEFFKRKGEKFWSVASVTVMSLHFWILLALYHIKIVIEELK